MNKLQLEIPEGMIIDVENSDLSKGVIKLKHKDVQKKWEDFGEVNGYYINENSHILKTSKQKSFLINRNIIPTESLAKAMLALSELFQWRNKVWEEDNNWKPNLNDNSTKHAIVFNVDEINILYNTTTSRILSFRTKEIANQFLNDHKDLIEQAKEVL